MGMLREEFRLKEAAVRLDLKTRGWKDAVIEEVTAEGARVSEK